ncbi:MAG: 4-hydroxy-3-methylbut-2-enyl diphosphate reductase [Muribaculaceae bacterium]|nr:4-hydroxy-3-methylbut-2-enyl diphosphate reductase [Muribaculaceae bacterium]
MAIIEIDKDSGFCFGVVTAIRKAEEQLAEEGSLFCLGDIVHNSDEVERLESKGLKTITHSDLAELRDANVLLRAHGEPPETYRIAEKRNIRIIDATCPVVLQLQRRIKQAYDASADSINPPLILIYGKVGHAEVNGLVGQTDGTAVVIQKEEDLDQVDLNRDVLLYSQTTKSLDGFQAIVDAIKKRKTAGKFEYFDTICRQVANRMPHIRRFAASHEVILFVCGKKSSNGKVLFNECKSVNPRAYLISNTTEIDMAWFENIERIGICGATSTPSWLMADVKNYLEKTLNT